MSSDHVINGNIFSDPSGSKLDQAVSFKLLEMVGEGGMGIVYRAEQIYPRRIVALKLMKASAVAPKNVQRFDREISVLAKLQHPCVSQLFSVGTIDGHLSGPVPFLAMEFIDGQPITSHARERGLGIREKLELMIQVCDGVAHAHEHGIVHRDLKPSNILVSHSGGPRIVDFGLAMILDQQSPPPFTLTEDGQLVGTLDYMSPEQAKGDNLDHRTDIYALGVILYELLSGIRPFDLSHCTIIEAVQRIQEAEVARLSSTSRAYRGDLDVIAGKALARDVDQRYPSARALADDLRRFLANEPIWARRPTLRYRTRKFLRRHCVLAVATCCVFLALCSGLALAVRQSLRANREAARAREEAIQAKLAGGDALFAGGDFVRARSMYEGARETMLATGHSTLAADVALWDVCYRSGGTLRVLEKDGSNVQSVALDGLERQIAIGYASGRILIRDVVTDAIVMDVRSDANPIRVGFSPNGKLLLIQNSKKIEVWDITHRSRMSFRDFGDQVPVFAGINDREVAFFDHNDRVLVASVTDLNSGQEVRLGNGKIRSMGVAPNGIFIVDYQGHVSRIAQGHLDELGILPASAIFDAAFADDGSKMMTFGDGVGVFELPSLRRVGRFEKYKVTEGGFVDANTLWFPNPTQPVMDYVNCDGHLEAQVPRFNRTNRGTFKDIAVAWNADSELVLYTPRMPAAARVLVPTSDPVQSAALSADGYIAAAAFGRGQIKLIDTMGGHLLDEFEVSASVRALTFDAATTCLYVVTADKRIIIRDLKLKTAAVVVPTSGFIAGFAAAPSGLTACYSIQGKQGMTLIARRDKQYTVKQLDATFEPTNIAFSPGGDQVAGIGMDCCSIFDTSSGVCRGTIRTTGKAWTKVTFLGDRLVTGKSSTEISRWNLSHDPPTSAPLAEVPEGFSGFWVAPHLVAIRYKDHVLTFDPDDAATRHEAIWDSSFLRHLAVSANGKQWLAAGNSGLIFGNWELPDVLRASRHEPEGAQLLAYFVAKSYPPVPGGYSSTNQSVEDAFAFWAAGADTKAHRIFSSLSSMTAGTKELLMQATQASPGF